MVMRAEGDDSFPPGTSLDEAFELTLAMAQAGQMLVQSRFNGRPILAWPSDSLTDVIEQYKRHDEQVAAAKVDPDRLGLFHLLDSLGMGYGLHDELRRKVIGEWADKIIMSVWLRGILDRILEQEPEQGLEQK